MRMSVIEGHTPRADLLRPEQVRILDRVPRPVALSNCLGCGLGLPNEGEAARHLVVKDGDAPTEWNARCPRWVLAREGQRTGDSILVVRGGHLVRMFIHGLSPDGSPRIWSGSAQHQDECGCCRECGAPVAIGHRKECPTNTGWEFD